MEETNKRSSLPEKAKQADICQEGCEMWQAAKSKSDLLKAITLYWDGDRLFRRIITAEYLEDNFSEEELTGAGIYTKGST